MAPGSHGAHTAWSALSWVWEELTGEPSVPWGLTPASLVICALVILSPAMKLPRTRGIGIISINLDLVCSRDTVKTFLWLTALKTSYLASCSSCSSSCPILASRAEMVALNLDLTAPSSSCSLAFSSLFCRSSCWRALSLFWAALRSAASSVFSVSTWRGDGSVVQGMAQSLLGWGDMAGPPAVWSCGSGRWAAPCCSALPPALPPAVRSAPPDAASHPAVQTCSPGGDTQHGELPGLLHPLCCHKLSSILNFSLSLPPTPICQVLLVFASKHAAHFSPSPGLPAGQALLSLAWITVQPSSFAPQPVSALKVQKDPGVS